MNSCTISTSWDVDSGTHRIGVFHGSGLIVLHPSLPSLCEPKTGDGGGVHHFGGMI